MTNFFTRVIALLSCIAGIALTSEGHAGTYSAFAGDSAARPGCTVSIGGGGYGIASAAVPEPLGGIPGAAVPCLYESPDGEIVADLVFASGSWITGDFTVFAEANTLPVAGHNPMLEAVGSDTFTDSGKITLPAGMKSAGVTFGVTGLSGTAQVLDPGSAIVDQIELKMNGVQSLACENVVSINSPCSPSQLALGFGPGALPPITETVTNGETLSLSVSASASAFASGFSKAQGSIVVDPLYLTLPPGVTFDSGIPNFLSGAPPAIPEPSIWMMLVTGFVGLGWLARRRSSRRNRLVVAI